VLPPRHGGRHPRGEAVDAEVVPVGSPKNRDAERSQFLGLCNSDAGVDLGDHGG
jgi:hypothetical protein